MSIDTFSKTANNLESSATLLLFLNKMDLFTKKINSDKLFKAFKKAFPDYDGKQDATEAAEHIAELFKSKLTREPDEVTVHFTCALDTEAMGAIFTSMRDDLIRSRAAASGVIM